MSKYNLIVLWENVFPHQNEAYDYAGRRMLKSAIGNQNSRYCPTIDHIRPLAKGGKDVLENIVICAQETNEEKADTFPNWYANGRRFQARKVTFFASIPMPHRIGTNIANKIKID